MIFEVITVNNIAENSVILYDLLLLYVRHNVLEELFLKSGIS